MIYVPFHLSEVEWKTWAKDKLWLSVGFLLGPFTFRSINKMEAKERDLHVSDGSFHKKNSSEVEWIQDPKDKHTAIQVSR